MSRPDYRDGDEAYSNNHEHGLADGTHGAAMSGSQLAAMFANMKGSGGHSEAKSAGIKPTSMKTQVAAAKVSKERHLPAAKAAPKAVAPKATAKSPHVPARQEHKPSGEHSPMKALGHMGKAIKETVHKGAEHVIKSTEATGSAAGTAAGHSTIKAIKQEGGGGHGIFKSEAQRRYLWANDPKVAQEFADKTPKGTHLPWRVKKDT